MLARGIWTALFASLARSQTQSSVPDLVSPTNWDSSTLSSSQYFSLGLNYSSLQTTINNGVISIVASSDSSSSSASTSALSTLCSGVLVQPSSVSQVNSSVIALVSCDNQTKATALLESFQNGANPQCTLLYSLTNNGCNFTQQADASDVALLGVIFSVTSASTAQSIVNTVQKNTTITASIGISQSSSRQTTSSTPSSVVVAAVLYSIMGVAVAAFLIIIISGAVRLHRHPERYGLNEIGGPGDGDNGAATTADKARSLARAVLDSIPLVRVGNARARWASGDGGEDLEMQKQHHRADEHFGKSCRDSVITRRDSIRELDSYVSQEPKGSEKHQNGKLFIEQEDGSGSTAKDKETHVSKSIELPESRDCPICYEQFADGDILRVLPCDHIFHANCVDHWLLNSSCLCPVCRVDVSLQNNEQVSDEPPLELETSRFNRFLDIWNAQLLPRDTRRRALDRFRQEAQARRDMRNAEENRSRWRSFVNSRRRIIHRHQVSNGTVSESTEGVVTENDRRDSSSSHTAL